MYVRKKFMRRADKVYGPYWQVVRSIRLDGKPQQRVVANLGALPDRDTARVVAKMGGLMCGEDSCGRAGDLRKDVTISYGFQKEVGRALLCEEHARELGSGKRLTAVALREE
jgi:hypothetical protein